MANERPDSRVPGSQVTSGARRPQQRQQEPREGEQQPCPDGSSSSGEKKGKGSAVRLPAHRSMSDLFSCWSGTERERDSHRPHILSFDSRTPAGHCLPSCRAPLSHRPDWMRDASGRERSVTKEPHLTTMYALAKERPETE